MRKRTNVSVCLKEGRRLLMAQRRGMRWRGGPFWPHAGPAFGKWRVREPLRSADATEAAVVIHLVPICGPLESGVH